MVEYVYDAWGNCTIKDTTANYVVAHANPICYREYYYDEEFWYINTLPKSTLLNIELMGITYADTSYHISRRSQWDMYVFEYVVSGVGYINCNQKKYTVKSGDAYIIKSFTEHEYYADKQEPYQKIWINILKLEALMQLFRYSITTLIPLKCVAILSTRSRCFYVCVCV